MHVIGGSTHGPNIGPAIPLASQSAELTATMNPDAIVPRHGRERAAQDRSQDLAWVRRYTSPILILSPPPVKPPSASPSLLILLLHTPRNLFPSVPQQPHLGQCRLYQRLRSHCPPLHSHATLLPHPGSSVPTKRRASEELKGEIFSSTIPWYLASNVYEVFLRSEEKKTRVRIRGLGCCFSLFI
jgi:hypothetical protein